jgi:hypothetical protein
LFKSESLVSSSPALLCFALLCQHPKFNFSSKFLPDYQKFTETRTKYSVSNENKKIVLKQTTIVKHATPWPTPPPPQHHSRQRWSSSGEEDSSTRNYFLCKRRRGTSTCVE